MTEVAKPHYTAEVESFEVSRNKAKPHYIGTFRVKIEPIGLVISNVRVTQNKDGRLWINMPATPANGGWRENVTLPPPLYGALRAAILDELSATGLMPARYDAPAEPAS